MFVDRPVGIDLGTTNSEIALLDPSERDLLIYADRFGRRTVPSAVAWDPKASAFVVGHAARARRGKDPGPVESIKRKMGQTTAVPVGPNELTPEEVSSKILGELRAKMLEHLGGQAQGGIEVRVDRAVITVPAYFDAPQVEATRKAGELAGLSVIGILQEPTAAAIYHTWKSRLGDGNFLVYDLGGGTFDVSVLRCVGGEYQVLAIDGDNFLGGDDFDRRYAERLRADLVTRGYALELDVLNDDEDRRRFGRIVHLAQEIKESLSTSEVVHINKQGIVDDKAGEDVSFDAEIGRAEYEKAVGDLVETTIECCMRALRRSQETASVGLADIDHIVLVGGSTRVPLVIRRVTEALCAKSKSEKPLQDEVDTCVALGAAIHAAQIGGLRLGEPAAQTTVLFTTPLVAKDAKIKVGLRVEEAPKDAAEVVVLAGDQPLAKAPLGQAKDAALRLEIALGEAPEQQVRLAIRAADGRALSEIPFALYRGDVRPRASALSRPSVVAKDIALEVVRAGRRERRVLLSRGMGLPAESTHRFFTADQSGAVVLRLLQSRMPIKTLLLQVPTDLPVGTGVDLTLRCDEAMRMEARAVVAGQELWAQIEPPQQARFDPRGAVDTLLADAESVGRSLWGSLGQSYRREADKLAVGIREVVATDPDKLTALCERLRLLVDEFRGGPTETLAPPMHRFESELDDLRRLVYRSNGVLIGMDRAAWDARIAEIEERAHAAYNAADAAAWRRVYNEVLALYETASQEEFAAMRIDDPAYLTRRLAGVVRYANRIELALTDFVPAAADEVRAMQLVERDRLLASLKEKVQAPIQGLSVGDEADNAAARRKLEQVSSELSRIEAALERIPSLGLVTERGG
jgi:molecular chaperone DnaK